MGIHENIEIKDHVFPGVIFAKYQLNRNYGFMFIT